MLGASETHSRKEIGDGSVLAYQIQAETHLQVHTVSLTPHLTDVCVSCHVRGASLMGYVSCRCCPCASWHWKSHSVCLF